MLPNFNAVVTAVCRLIVAIVYACKIVAAGLLKPLFNLLMQLDLITNEVPARSLPSCQ